MLKLTTLLLISTATLLPLSAYANSCKGISQDTYHRLDSYDRTGRSGGFDRDGNGQVEYHEVWGKWDFNQVHDILQMGLPNQKYAWTNVDTCYKFVVIPLNTVEDKSMHAINATCRHFVYTLRDPDGDPVLSDGGKDGHSGYACRNFATQVWKMM